MDADVGGAKQAQADARSLQVIRLPRGITPQEFEQAVAVFWPHYDSHAIAAFYCWAESAAANVLARLTDRRAVQ